MKIRKITSVLLVLALCLSVMPRVALARQSEQYWFQTEPMELHTSRTVPTVMLAEGRHQHYQDRLKDLPAYAMDFYGWLERNADSDGALADPTLGTASPNGYYYTVARISGTEAFTFQTREERDAMAGTIAREAVDRELAVFSGYACAMYSAFDREHPEVFWLTGRSKYGAQCGYTYSTRGNTCTVYYDVDLLFWLKNGSFDVRRQNYCSQSAVAQGIALRDAAVQEILNGCTSTDPYEQICYLNRALTQRNAYNGAVGEGRSDDADPEAWESISALTGRTGDRGPVCEGYARAFMVLCQKLGIPCVLADGLAKSKVNETPGAHMWNHVQLEGNWYAVDSAWNDPYVPWMPEEPCSGHETEKWLLLGSESMVDMGLCFGQSHDETNDIGGNGLCYTNGPKLSSGIYVPKAGYSVGGTVTSFGDTTAPVTLELQAEGETRSLSITGNRADFCFEKVPSGSYTLTVSKADHVDRSVSFTLEDQPVTRDMKLCLLGDLTGDGRINIADVSKLYAHVRGAGAIQDEYVLRCADMTGEGRINVADTSRLYTKVRNGK